LASEIQEAFNFKVMKPQKVPKMKKGRGSSRLKLNKTALSKPAGPADSDYFATGTKRVTGPITLDNSQSHSREEARFVSFDNRILPDTVRLT